MRYQYYYDTPIGGICLEEYNDCIAGVHLEKKEGNIRNCSRPYPTKQRETCLLKEAYRQLMEYFLGERKIFQLPIYMEGTAFQKKVWRALQEIPYGDTRSYGEIAAAIGNPKACRAVGGANHKNALTILVPCHRVIGKDGSLIGFGGGLAVKKYLLELEKSHI